MTPSAESGSELALPWQRAEWEGLAQRVAARRLHHALLLSGPAGIGKRRLAARLALSVLCTDASCGNACSRCRSCQLMLAGTHPDWLLVAPEEPGKQIRINQIREDLWDFVTRTPSISAHKVVMLDPAEAMNVATANCLLKSLEEPAAGTHMLLVSDAPVRLLPTIRSRCEHLRLRPPGTDEARSWLVAQRGEEGAEDLLGAASGCPLAALRLGTEGGLEQFDRVADVMCRARVPPAWIASLAAELNDVELRELLRWMQLFLADLARWLGDPAAARLPRAAALYDGISGRVNPSHVARSFERVTVAAREAASAANPNRQLLIESLLMAWSEVPGDIDGLAKSPLSR